MSVFTYDPNPPRVSSPWLQAANVDVPSSSSRGHLAGHDETPGDGPVAHSLLSEYGVTRLPPEPQEGPVEYKLHLLLRPRRSYKFIPPTASAGSPKVTADPKFLQKRRVVGSATTGQTRQSRCEHLMTQLLWRLRQSSPYHASVAQQDPALPLLPEDSAIAEMPVTLGKLAPGLEESRGALYEIGVADDGALVGITKDELDQSIATLRWMAAHLGCVSKILRIVEVGQCEWTEETKPSGNGTVTLRDRLWVAEVFVQPHMNSQGNGSNGAEAGTMSTAYGGRVNDLSTTLGSTTADQLRVTLTGPTGSGKSTLLGTLSTGALDDGHGKSRLNSLKHRHEMASGLTSTVTQELVGYSDEVIVNYSNTNIESWIGIHDYTKNGRLVFISDSAGHPRFRRTTLRGLIGWSPHWTLLCLSTNPDDADSGTSGDYDTGSGTSTPLESGSGTNSAALAKAHLDFCVKLGLPLAIVLTKSDLLNKESLKRTLAPIWTAIKTAGRLPQLLQSKQKATENTRSVSPIDAAAIERVLTPMRESQDFRAVVPVILTSCVNGDGIGLIHALLKSLPLPPKPTSHDYIGKALNPEQPEALFHIEDRFKSPVSYATASLAESADSGHVLSGYLRFGKLSVGDPVVIGPFPSDEDGTGSGLDDDRTASPSHNSLSSSHPSSAELARIAARNAISASALKGEWHEARIETIRNLRLPVQTLDADQVGTIGLVILPPTQTKHGSLADGSDEVHLSTAALKPRRGMVVAVPSKHMLKSGLQLQAASGLTAFFEDVHIGRLSIGTPVTFYVASVRAQGRVAKVWSSTPVDDFGKMEATDDGVFDSFEHAEEDEKWGGPAAPPNHGYSVRLELLYGREWIELGSQVVILEGASKEGSVLDGFVGKVVEIMD
ncbi:hypothetical protein HMPREF1624_01365 [Sporothrix schenckii ATCC 58251]|uniref:Tr-type G domain-containing protein n=1 Tax=Sporothrix schenckii (strain ATCC 58251 / de Perez 2211183) TaxID=1391915 RepID=U7Q7Q2_SPOS1|nr:hypothetical protein HMPREF1624_01365 [Sporothrix schenckii ATCC 58251]